LYAAASELTFMDKFPVSREHLHGDVTTGTAKRNTGRFKKSFTALKAYVVNLFRTHVQCFELSYVANHTEFYLGYLWFSVTSTGNAERES
jgi:hypothetical protein